MPRPMKNRDPFGERNVARRVALERERRGMTYEGLAKRMTDAGCEIHTSALYKIEKGDPPRRITVTELLAFSKVLELPLAELVADPETYLPQHVYELVDKAARANSRAWRLQGESIDLLQQAERLTMEAREKVQGEPGLADVVSELVSAETTGSRPATPVDIGSVWRDVAGEFELQELLGFSGGYNSYRRAGIDRESALKRTSQRTEVDPSVAERMLAECLERGIEIEGEVR